MKISKDGEIDAGVPRLKIKFGLLFFKSHALAFTFFELNALLKTKKIAFYIKIFF